MELGLALGERQPELHLVFTGLIKKPSLRQELEQLAAEKNLTNRIHWLGLVSDGEIAEIFKRASLMIFPSRFEGFGLPILEAYRAGLPVVAARNSSLTEVAGDGALFCTTDNLSEFTATVARLLTDEPLRQKLIAAGHRQLAHFSWRQTAQTTLE